MGITFSLHERSEVWPTSPAGGGHQGLSYNGLTIAKLNLDLDALFGWSGGEFFVSAFDIHGHVPSRSFIGNQQILSNIEATPSVKLYDLWLDQTLFDKKLSIRIGQEGANDEMMTTAYGAIFLNSSFGFPGTPASNLPSDAPNYPLASPFARVLYSPADKFTIVGAVYTAAPAPPGTGDPQVRDRNGTAFRLNDHSLAFGELWYSPDSDAPDNLPTTYKLGGWYATNNFADQRLDNAGGLLASSTGTRKPLNHIGDWAVYYRRSENLAARGFKKPGHRCVSASHGWAEQSQNLSSVFGWLTLQPDIHYVINPNAGPNNFGNVPLSNALVIGMRATIRL